MVRSNHEFDLSSFIIDSLCLDENISPHTKNQYQKIQKDPIQKLLSTDPREALGFNSFGESRQTPENTTGTPIQEFYRGLHIFVTGGTGFVGKVLIEKLIRSVPHLGKIYVLLRAKKGLSAAERFEKLLENEVFLRMKTEVPNYQSKLMHIEGDISEPELGLKEADRRTLQSQVHVVFHSAADVRFVNSLRAAVNSNLLGSQRVIDLAKGMKNLKSYVYVSTAFSHCVRRVIEEKHYKLSFSYLEVLKLLQEKTDDEIRDEEISILQGWPNTYTFSKALSEDMISEESKDLPICIFRPSVLLPAYMEPLRGWVDSMYGFSGMLLAFGLGLIHMFKIDMSLHIDVVPVDFTVNAMIAAAWENATDRNDHMPVYNFTSFPRNPVTWRLLEVIGRKHVDVYPLHNAIWHQSFMTTSSPFVAKVGDFLLHRIPAMILDGVAIASGREARLTRVFNKLSVLRKKLNYFTNGVWEFQTENITLLLNKLTEEDKELFCFDIAKINNLEEYFLLSRLGIKYFYLKESLESMPDAVRKASWLKLAHRSLLVVSSLAALKLLVVIAHLLPI